MIFEKTVTVITKIFIYYKVGMVSVSQKKDEYFKKLKRQKSLGGLKEFIKFNIFIAEHGSGMFKGIGKAER